MCSLDSLACGQLSRKLDKKVKKFRHRLSPRRLSLYVKVKVYTSPSCPRCEALKDALKRLGIPFEEADVSNTEVMADLIMRDIYLDSTPALEVQGRLYSSEELFDGDRVKEELLKEVVGRD
ncbi:MAG: hypothetical protein DRJ97_08415 [Thermoprotei archaeon]|nr:MAG: hypothetical protein DRJ97_08415 [Thermoprotei archaeon]